LKKEYAKIRNNFVKTIFFCKKYCFLPHFFSQKGKSVHFLHPQHAFLQDFSLNHPLFSQFAVLSRKYPII